MAMNGVNMPLSIIGTQGVWFETLLEYGFTEREALAYLSGPAYWPWQLMTNLEGAMPRRTAAMWSRASVLAEKFWSGSARSA